MDIHVERVSWTYRTKINQVDIQIMLSLQAAGDLQLLKAIGSPREWRTCESY